MRILLLAPIYMDLHKPIINEMEQQGHEVTFVEDVMFSWDWKYPWRGWWDKTCRRMKISINRIFQNYWQEALNNKPELDCAFERFIVINGCSFHPCLIKSLQKKSPNLKTVLYLWDNSHFYDYYHYANCFDKVMTYDIDDSQKYHVELLPFYWQPISADLLKLPIKYKLSMIGSNHDNRYTIAQNINNQLGGVKRYLKVLDKTMPKDNIIIHHPIPVDETLQIMIQSECILDTDRESQSGTTPRLIWALAMGKKVITTNVNIKRMPFYNPTEISIIDRNNPIIDKTFLNSTYKEQENTYLQTLRIDNWVKNFLEV